LSQEEIICIVQEEFGLDYSQKLSEKWVYEETFAKNPENAD
jgi:hypothetical protein